MESLDDCTSIELLKQESIELKQTKAFLDDALRVQTILQQRALLRNEIASLGFDICLVPLCDDDKHIATMMEKLQQTGSQYQSECMPRTRAAQGSSPAEPPVPPESVHSGQQTDRGAGGLLAPGLANTDVDMSSPLEREIEFMRSIIEPVDDLVPKVRSPILPAKVQRGQGAKGEGLGGLGRGRPLTAEGSGTGCLTSVSLAAYSQSGLSALLALPPGLVDRNSHKHGSSGTMEVADGGAPLGVVPVATSRTASSLCAASGASARDASASGSLATGSHEDGSGRQGADESSRCRLWSLGPHDTTLVVRNIPVRYTQEILQEEWPPNGKYNFLHLPCSFKVGRTLGFAFVNFTSCANALEFQSNWQGRFLAEHCKIKFLDIVAAEVRGYRANLERFIGKRFLSKHRFLPALFDGTRRLNTRDVLQGMGAMKVERTPINRCER